MATLKDLINKLIDKTNAAVKTDAQTLTDAQKEQARANIGAISVHQGVTNAGKILMVDANGNLMLSDVPEMGLNGDIVGVVSDNNSIVLTGVLPEGTYAIKYEMEDGSYQDIGSLTLSSEYDVPLTLTLGKIDYNNNGAIVASDTYLYSDAIIRERNKEYTVSLVGEGAKNAIRVVYYNADGNFIGLSENINGFKSAVETGAWNLPLSDDAEQFRLRVYHSSSELVSASVQNLRLTKRTLKYTNLLPTAVGTDGTILDGIGYRDGYIPGSYPNAFRERPGYFQTGFFPYTLQQAKDRVPIYVKGITIDLTNLDGNITVNMSPEYNTTDWIGNVGITDMTSTSQMTITQLGEKYYMFRPNSNYYTSNGWGDYDLKYMHMGLPGSGAGVIITVDDPIE